METFVLIAGWVGKVIDAIQQYRQKLIDLEQLKAQVSQNTDEMLQGLANIDTDQEARNAAAVDRLKSRFPSG